MKQSNEIPFEVKMIVPFADWASRHPRIINAIIITLGLILAWVVVNYEFTTRI